MALRHAGMLEVNEFLVLDFVRDRGTTTRPDIARTLGLSDSSVSRIVARLLKSGLVVESPGQATTAGRPRSTITFNHRAGCVLAVDLGGTNCHGALADLSGATLCEDVRPTLGPRGAFDALSETISRLRAAADERGIRVHALAVGIPAILDPESGTAVGGPAVDWQGFEIVDHLRATIGDTPFLVENDANLAALAHAWRGEARSIRDFVTIVMGTGIGAAVVANGQLVKGRHNAAGEVGYLVVDREQLGTLRLGASGEPDERPGGLGGLEKVAAASSLVRRARMLVADGVESTLAGTITPEAVFAAALAGDALALTVIDELLDYTALALVAVTAIVDPEVVILDGSIGRSLEPFLDRLADRLRGRLLFVPDLSISRLGPNATVVGAIAAALQLAREQHVPSALFGEFKVSGRAGAHA